MGRWSVVVPDDIMLASLADGSVSIIGICGFPWVGLRLATRVGEKAQKEKLFLDVLTVGMVAGSFLPTINELHSRLVTEERILIILDEVPETFDLEKIGYLLQKPLCKIIITSQFKSIFLRMRARRIFAAAQEDLELWSLLREKSGSYDLYPLGRSRPVAKECRGLLDLNVNDRSLKEESNLLLSVRTSKPALAYGSALQMEIVAPFERRRVQHSMSSGSIHPHPELSSQVIGGTRGVNLQYDVNEKSFCLSARQSIIMEKVVAYPPESFLTNCTLFCSVLPVGYRFSKDMLVSQWIAQALIKLEEDEIVEEVCSRLFVTLLNSEYIVAAGYDFTFDRPMYEVGDKMIAFFKDKLLEPKYQKKLDSVTDASVVEYLSLDYEELDLIDFGILKRCSRLQTLIIHRCYGSKVKHLPSDLFWELNNLKILIVSHTNVEVLTCDLDNLKELRYIDISGTPIKWLPERLCCLSNLETLRLDGCSNISALPDSISELVNLRHLILDIVTRLDLMPKGIGKLTKLRTLSAFLVDDYDGHRIGELKNLNKLKGSIKLWRLESVKTKEAAAEAWLCKKHGLKKIQLCWGDLWDEKYPAEEEVLESLQPPSGIQELRIWFYSGGRLPSWMSNPAFNELVSITLYGCRYCDSLPSLGDLPSLKVVQIVKSNVVVEVASSFCRKQPNQHHVAFPKLEKLSFESMLKFEKWTGLEEGDFPCLSSLKILYCPEFVGLPYLSQLKSLSYMVIMSCPKLSCLPEGGLPPVLEVLRISDCPGLEERYFDNECEEWSKVLYFFPVY